MLNNAAMKILVIPALLLVVCAFYISPALSLPPRMPFVYWGNFYLGTGLQPVPDDLTVAARINGTSYSTYQTSSGSYFFQVGADDLASPPVEGGNEGDVIYTSIIIDNVSYTAAETVTWHEGGSVNRILTLNRQPVLEPVGDQIINKSESIVLTLMAFDPDEDNVVYNAIGLPQGCILDNGTFTWTPDYDQAGSYNITFEVTDGVLVDNETMRITVNNLIKGDFSGDGTTDSWDITYLARSIIGITGYGSLSSGDVSGDWVVDAWDCTYMARAIAGVQGYGL